MTFSMTSGMHAHICGTNRTQGAVRICICLHLGMSRTIHTASFVGLVASLCCMLLLDNLQAAPGLIHPCCHPHLAACSALLPMSDNAVS